MIAAMTVTLIAISVSIVISLQLDFRASRNIFRLFACFSALFLTANSLIRTFWNSFAGLGIIAIGIPVYFFWNSRRKKAGA